MLIRKLGDFLVPLIEARERDPAPTAAQIERQIRWEEEAVEAGIRRYREELRAQTLADTSPGQRIIRKIITEFVPWLADAQAAKREGFLVPGRPQDWTFLLLLLPPDELAFLTLRAVMSEHPTTDEHLRTLTGCARSLAASIEQEVAFRSWLAEERSKKREARQLGQPYQDLYESLRRSTRKVDNRAFKKWMNRLDRLWRQGWEEEEKFKLGSNLIELLVEHSGGIFEIVLSRRSGKTSHVILLSPEAREIIEDHHARAEVMCPTRRPMLCQPKSWQSHGEQGRYVGGYYQLLPGDLIHSKANQHTRALTDPFSAETLQAINTLQNTPWQINRAVFDVMQAAWKGGVELGELIPPADRKILERIPDDVWKTMTPEQQQEHKTRLAEIHADNAHQEGRRYSWLLKLDIASQLIDKPMIWFPYHADFRGRLYPEVSYLSPQGNDAGKALLRFAHGKPLGNLGLFWLCVRAATCYATEGTLALDKLPLNDRVKWVDDNRPRILEAAENPIDGTRWWTEAEEPWSFLATCFELAQALTCTNPEEFVSHLPIPLDGSCNGLQHLAAMGRDPVVARATNCHPIRNRRPTRYLFRGCRKGRPAG